MNVEAERAIEIVQALADGVEPYSRLRSLNYGGHAGELFPSDSAYGETGHPGSTPHPPTTASADFNRPTTPGPVVPPRPAAPSGAVDANELDGLPF